MLNLPIKTLPDHTQLPESDGTIVQNFQEHPQSILLTDSIDPLLKQLNPDNQYAIGQDCGIYWGLTDPPLNGCKAPDWFYVPNVPPMLDGQIRRSYVLWQEYVAPLILIEFVSGDGTEERDATPPPPPDQQGEWKVGKFWVYEQAIRAPFYAIYEVQKASVEVYQLIDNRYQLLEANERGRYAIYPMGVELGIWQGSYRNQTAPWLRWWDSQGNLLLTGDERAEQEREAKEAALQQVEEQRQQAESERLRAESEHLRAERLAERLREMGINPDEL